MLGAIFVLQMLSGFNPTFGLEVPFVSTLPTLRSEMPKPQAIPTADNQCGRTEAVYLAPIAATRMMPDYPASAIRHAEQGASLVQMLVDKDGVPRNLHVTRSSGYADLDEAAVDAVENYRWVKPRGACADMGVQLNMTMNWDMGVPTVTITPSSPDYPAIAKAQNLAGLGAVLVTQTGDTVTDIKMEASTGSPELDKAMMDFAHAQIAMPSLMRDGGPLTATMPFMIRYNPDPARPVTQLPVNLPLDIVADQDTPPTPMAKAKP